MQPIQLVQEHMLPSPHHIESLLAYFSQFGSVVGCEIMRRDGVPRGFAFVVSSADAEVCCSGDKTAFGACDLVGQILVQGLGAGCLHMRPHTLYRAAR